MIKKSLNMQSYLIIDIIFKVKLYEQSWKFLKILAVVYNPSKEGEYKNMSIRT